MDDIVTNELYAEIDRLRARVKELEAERDGYRNGQQQLQNTLSTVMDSNAKWANDYKELEAENRRLREALDRIESMATIENTEIQKIAREAMKEASHEG